MINHVECSSDLLLEEMFRHHTVNDAFVDAADSTFPLGAITTGSPFHLKHIKNKGTKSIEEKESNLS